MTGSDRPMDIRREILRNVILCQSLEPLGTRPDRNLPPDEPTSAHKIEYFVVAGVNSSWPFYDLADRVLTHRGQPDCIFDAAYEAQSASVRNRLGGKINYGPIMLLVPIITAQALEYLESGTHEDVEAILRRTGDVLRATTEQDVASMERFIHLGYEISARHRVRIGRPKPPRYPLLRGKYANVWDAAHGFPDNQAVRELIQGFPYSHQVYRFLLHNLETGILQATELIYNFLLPELGRPDAVADVITTGLYLVLTKHPESVLFV
ncbi:MAG: triphosphoribosyl-dephospho-CoA synthase [Acidobacteria bacterium]|nr:triphosphoribosyl-dephospho-CoA synthase [Acidobacteriota bacterium]